MSSNPPATVTVAIDGKDYVLTPSVDRMRILNRLMGGLTPLFRAVANCDGDAMALIVAAGTGARGAPVEDITSAVYRHGLEDLVDPLTRFLTFSANGGRDPEVARAPAGEGGAAPAAGASDGTAPSPGDASDQGRSAIDAPPAREAAA